MCDEETGRSTSVQLREGPHPDPPRGQSVTRKIDEKHLEENEHAASRKHPWEERP